MRTISERTDSFDELIRILQDKFSSDLMVALPGIVNSFDATEQTVSVQVALKERITQDDGTVSDVQFPLLVDVPIVIPRAGGFAVTLPVVPGDECLVIFSDMCIDSWWSYGGIRGQADKRRHDLSDGFAILGCWSQPRRISNYSTNSLQIRSLTGSAMIDVKPNEIDINATTVKINGVTQG